MEFIVSADAPDEFFFMEMNTRLQVEHPVTEMVTGVDLVEQQVRIAAGEKLAIGQDDIVMTGHAVEARVYAEGPGQRLPAHRWTGARTASSPAAPGSEVDSGLGAGTVVGSDYDPMLSKVIAYGSDRTVAPEEAGSGAGRHRGAGADHQYRVSAFPAGRSRCGGGSVGHRPAGPPAHPILPLRRSGIAELIAAAAVSVASDWAEARRDNLWAVPDRLAGGARAARRIPAAGQPTAPTTCTSPAYRATPLRSSSTARPTR